MANRALPTPEILRQLLRYEPDTGKVYWLERPVEMFTDTSDRRGREWVAACWNRRFAGKEASSPHANGQHQSIVIFYVRYLAHRVIWKMIHGDEPHRIDHRDLDGTNNRIGNLRRSTVSQNGMNRKPPSTNKSGIKGVHQRADNGRWSAMLVANGKAHRFGCFDTKDEAAKAYRKGALLHQGEFANFEA